MSRDNTHDRATKAEGVLHAGPQWHDARNPLDAHDMQRIHDIMHEAFPVDELPSDGEFAAYAAQTDRRQHTIVHRDAQHAIDAFAFLFDLNDTTLYLSYFAVTAQTRGQGVGGAMMDDIIEACGTKTLVAEIEIPGSTPMAQRRAEFYKRHGMYVNDGAYVQPPLKPGDEELPLLLITYPKPVQGRAFTQLRLLLYNEGYGGYVPQTISSDS